MRNILLAAVSFSAAFALALPRADACGGFFCSAAPVDQNAERIVFAVDEANGTTDMVVQISYQGDDDAFAWVLPVGSVPTHRDVVPNGALGPLDSRTGPQFQPPPDCFRGRGGPVAASAADDDAAEDEGGDVTVHVRETVGPFDVVVLESPDPQATFEWLLREKYRLAPVMKPYIELYTRDKMKFLALKLTANASAKDIQPFKMTLAGTTPTIPLRLTAVAAEPEMGIVVWIFGGQRHEPANATEISIPKEQLKWDPRSWPIRTNWTELVARKVDDEGGKGWVVEQAGSTAALRSMIASSPVSDEQETARDALLALIGNRPYMTRLYTRVSPEEMTYDPIFRRSDRGDVSQTVELPYDPLFCEFNDGPPPVEVCDFAACGQLGRCSSVMDSVNKSRVAACACAPGSTARTTFDPQGQPTVACQDQRMSFMNPGERDEMGGTFPDPCVGFDCGEHGRCVAMNLTPTCECAMGYVAVGTVENGVRRTRCVVPENPVPKNFYNRRPPALAADMVAGREVVLAPAKDAADKPMADRYGDPSPKRPGKGKGCSAAPSEEGSYFAAFATLGAALFTYRRRRNR